MSQCCFKDLFCNRLMIIYQESLTYKQLAPLFWYQIRPLTGRSLTHCQIRLLKALCLLVLFWGKIESCDSEPSLDSIILAVFLGNRDVHYTLFVPPRVLVVILYSAKL